MSESTPTSRSSPSTGQAGVDGRSNRPDRIPTGQGLSRPGPEPANLADILERVLDKGLVIAGDIRVDLLDIELLTIKIRLLITSVDKAREIGIDWWEHDPSLSAGAEERRLTEQNRQLRERIAELESRDGAG